MNAERQAKQALVEQVNASMKEASTAIVVHNKGLTVAQMTEFRRNVRNAGARFQVVKNRLAKRAFEGTAYESLSGMMKGPTGIAYSTDPTSVAKAVADFAKNNEKLVIIGGAFGEKALDVKGVEALAKMPSLNELRAKLVGMLQTPATRIASVLQAPGGQLARVVAAYAKKQ